MSDSVIRVRNLSKRFWINHEHPEKYTCLRDVIAHGASRIFRRRKAAAAQEEFWALRDLDFEIRRGDRVGIIGRNGAGKSTLLKVLSRITEPTSGQIEIEGRVASLLEVGTGFHPELTGRENIFLNGAILGMSRAEIRGKFDEIVSFAEVEKFLDTPVKRYSSGMYVRLAFAVAAHLEPEILIVDEVLAVGDAQFQKKCLGKMQEVSENAGRTVLFVSHNMSTLKSLCSSIIYLRQGRKVAQGPVESAIRNYLESDRAIAESGRIPRDFHRKYQTGEGYFTSLAVTDLNGEPAAELYFAQPFRIIVELDILRAIHGAIINVLVTNASGENVALFADSQNDVYQPREFQPGRYKIELRSEAKFLPQSYMVSVFIAHFHNGTPIDWVENVGRFSVSGVSARKGGDYPWGLVHGYVEPPSTWRYSDRSAPAPMLG